MKTIRRHWITIIGIFSVVVVTALTAWSQTAPILTIAPTGTNQISITVTNATSGAGSYEIWTTPVLGNTVDYPWVIATVGTSGQTNFIVPIGPYPNGFYYAFQDTNAVPLWEAADPNNPSAGILTISIDSPTNGATLN